MWVKLTGVRGLRVAESKRWQPGYGMCQPPSGGGDPGRYHRSVGNQRADGRRRIRITNQKVLNFRALLAFGDVNFVITIIFLEAALRRTRRLSGIIAVALLQPRWIFRGSGVVPAYGRDGKGGTWPLYVGANKLCSPQQWFKVRNLKWRTMYLFSAGLPYRAPVVVNIDIVRLDGLAQ